MSTATVRIEYDDTTVRRFIFASILFGIVGMLVGLLAATQLVWWQANFGIPYTTFSRIRPLHTNAVIFAFVGNMMFAGIYYSTQRLMKARMARDLLSKVHFWGWQLIIVSAAITLPLGITTSKEYAELEWPIDIAIALIWVVFAINFFWTLAKRNEQQLYVAIWFYIATIITVAVLHIVNSFELPLAAEELLDLRRRAGRAGAVVVRPQRGRLLPHHADSGDHVLLPPQGGRDAGLLVPALAGALLVARLRLHLGRASPPAQHRAARLGPVARHGLQPDALGALVGRHAQRPAHPARRVEQAARGPGAQVLRRRRHLLRHVDLRGAADVDQVGQRRSRTTPTGSSPTCTAAAWGGTG